MNDNQQQIEYRYQFHIQTATISRKWCLGDWKHRHAKHKNKRTYKQWWWRRLQHKTIMRRRRCKCNNRRDTREVYPFLRHADAEEDMLTQKRRNGMEYEVHCIKQKSRSVSYIACYLHDNKLQWIIPYETLGGNWRHSLFFECVSSTVHCSTIEKHGDQGWSPQR